ncbi:hypothetical protein [Halomicrobium urmianum]|uniref:hypothetical protein n=1 Tax=Halomicrobium urmianum TaxID=1586233 RepID=UPI001CD92A54|nr:hypothetical protein [Halomicrobium urmianum]
MEGANLEIQIVLESSVTIPALVSVSLQFSHTLGANFHTTLPGKVFFAVID